MTTLNEAREAVYERFLSNFAGVTQDRIDLDNEDFDEPDDGAWVRCTVRHIDREQETLGRKTNRRFRSTASAFVQVYVPVDTGLKQSDTLATEARGIFEGESFSGLRFNAAATREAGPDGKWWQTVVEAQFEYDETK